MRTDNGRTDITKLIVNFGHFVQMRLKKKTRTKKIMVINTKMTELLSMMLEVTCPRFELAALLHNLHSVAHFAAVQ
jgi:hypothetical protein